MAHTTAALQSRGQLVVAIAGATGRLGDTVTRTFLSQPFSPHFSRVIALTRSSSSPKSQSLAEAGAEVVQVTFEDDNAVEGLTKALKGVDVVINVLGGAVSVKAKDNVARAAVDAGAVVYFPSEFGADHRQNDFADFENKEWIKKQDHLRYAQEISKGKNFKIIAVYNGLFLNLAFGPRFGFDFQATPPTLTSLGPSSVPASFTSTSDVARSLAQLSILASTNADDVPTHIRIQGSSASYDDIARIVERVKGLKEGEVKVTSRDLEEERKKLREASLSGTVTTPLTHIRVLVGEGRFDFSSTNQNEIVNPRGSLWEWTTVERYLEETLGGGEAK